MIVYVKKAGVFILIAVFVLSIAGSAFAAPSWLEDGSKKIPPGQLKKLRKESTNRPAPPLCSEAKEEKYEISRKSSGKNMRKGVSIRFTAGD